MNKKEARKRALQIAVLVISKEVGNPSELPEYFEDGSVDPQATRDHNKIVNELFGIQCELERKLERVEGSGRAS